MNVEHCEQRRQRGKQFSLSGALAMAWAKGATGSLMSDLRAFLQSSDSADVILTVGDSELPAHSQILAARSPVFAAMLRSDMQEARTRRIWINSVREDVVQQLLSFIYTDTVSLRGDLAAELLAAADMYDLPLLKKRCEDRMAKDVNVESAANTAALAALHRCPELMDTIVRFIARHPEVLDTDGWAQVLRQNAEVAVEISKKLAALLPRAPPVKASEKSWCSTPWSPDTDYCSLDMEARTMVEQRAPAATGSWNTSATNTTSATTATIAASTCNLSVSSTLATGAPSSTTTDDSIVCHILWISREERGGRLVQAAKEGKVDMVRALLEAGVDIEARDDGENTALHWAAEGGHVQVARCLLEAGAQVNARNWRQSTPLHHAANRGHAAVVRLLVAWSADLEARDQGMSTPLHCAARYGSNVEAVAALLEAGADKGARTKRKRTPLDLARRRGSNKRLREMLS